MKHLYSYILLSALFMSSCSNGSEYSDCLSQTNYCQDESNLYPEEELAGPNVFEHHNNQEVDDLLGKDKNAVRIDTKKGPIQRVLSYSEIVLTVWIGFDFSEKEYASLIPCDPVLSYQYFPYQTGISNSYLTYKKLPKYNDADYQVNKYEYPSRDSYYLSYHYKESVSINLSLLRNVNASKVELDLGIRMLDENKNDYQEPVSFPYSQNLRFNSIQIIFEYSENRDYVDYYIV